jgi:hypothetical protein
MASHRATRITEEDTLDVIELDQWDDYVQLAITEGYHAIDEPPVTASVSVRPERARAIAAMLNHLASEAERG